MDIYTDGKFIELPETSIFDDCEAWNFVLIAGYEWLQRTRQIVGSADDIEYARIDLIDWLSSRDCDPPEPVYTVLFKDTFKYAEGAPVTGTRGPSPIGYSVLSEQNGAEWEITPYALATAAVSSPFASHNLTYLTSESWQQRAGLAFKATIDHQTNDFSVLQQSIGFTGVLPPSNSYEAGINVTNQLIPVQLGGLVTGLDSSPAGVYELLIILREPGSFYFVRGGSSFDEWTLIWIANTSRGNDVYGLWTLSRTYIGENVSDFAIIDMPTATDENIVDSLEPGEIVPGYTFEHPVDCLLMVDDIGVISATPKRIEFRMQDSDNLWRLELTTTATILYEVVATVQTLRSSGTASASNSSVSILADGAQIKAFGGVFRRCIYNSANNFKTETDGNYTGSDSAYSLMICPRTYVGNLIIDTLESA